MAKFGLTQSSGPATEPITTAEAKTHIGIAAAETGFDTYVDSLIAAARYHVERFTNKQMVTATWQFVLDRLPLGQDEMLLPVAPVQSVTSIAYTDTAGDSQTWNSSNYVVTTSRNPARIKPAYSVSWPAVRCEPDAATVTFVAGFGNAAAVPDHYKHLMKLLIAHWFNQREAVLVGTIASSLPRAFDDMLNAVKLGDDFTGYAR